MPMTLGYRETLALTHEQLASHPSGNYMGLVRHVIAAAEAKGLIPRGDQGFEGTGLPAPDRKQIYAWVNEAMWDCVLKRLLVPGTGGDHAEWPFYHLTDYGLSVLKAEAPQPYDPDGFLGHFRTLCPNADPEVYGLLSEAVTAFNAGCLPATAVMLGCASEKLLLLLCDALQAAISGATKKAKFAKALGANWTLAHRYQILQEHLRAMATAKKLPQDEEETVEGALPSGYELARRCRNAAGHPEVPGLVDGETLFMNLRMFAEYARRATCLIEYLGSHPAE
jgi:hypothetical protein